MHLIAWDNITKPLTEGGLSFRNLRKSREAFMARNALKLLNNINLPWVRIMKGKYGELDPWKNPKLTTTSWAWRALNYTVQAIKLGLQISISDGLNTNFLEHPWLFTTPFSKKPTFIATNIGEKVQHINQIIENGEWCYNSIEGLVGEDLVDAITNLQLGEGPDKWVWSLHPQGKARAGSVYSFLNGHTDNCWDGWKQLWGLAVAPRVKTFLWKYFWKRLPTKDFLQQRGLTQSNLCALCGEAAENIQHLFFQCRYSKEVWHIFQLDWGKVINVQQLHDGCWLTSKVPNDLKAMIASILWCIWKSRCATLFNCESFIAPTIFRCAMAFWNAYNPTNKPTNKFAKQSTMDVETIVKWDPPPPGCFKINSDGAFNMQISKGGGGFIIRTDKGNLFCAGAAQFMATSALHAEAIALLEALKEAIKRGISKAIVEIDSQNLFSYVSSQIEPPWRLQNIIDRCTSLAKHLQQCIFVKIYREANRAADYLASHALNSRSKLVFDPTSDLPIDFVRILFEDSAGRVFLRKV
uniref:RNase H type-1 domain-containing protein n=2 Tax=Ananas comosus TaxID=4615 RepID=A0A6V7QPJ6_ANACO|nr:unnamed protein product [Ananas comosus var. bracteatus]